MDVVENKLKASSGTQTAKLQKELDRLKAGAYSRARGALTSPQTTLFPPRTHILTWPLPAELLPAQQAQMGLSMRTTLIAAACQFFVYWLLRRLYTDVPIAVLPFTPTWSYFRMIFQSGLTTAASVTEAQKAAGAVVHPSNAASYLPFMIAAGMLLRPLASKVAGTVESAKKLAGAAGGAPSFMEMSETLGKQLEKKYT